MRSRDELLGRLLCAMVASFVAVIALRCAGNAAQWVGRPFPGFLCHADGLISFLSRSHWPGPVHGVGYPDRVIAVNGNETSSCSEVFRIVESLPVGTEVRYRMQSGGAIREVRMPTARFTERDLWMTFGVFFLSGIACAAVGVITFLLRPAGGVTTSFLLFAYGMGLWCICKFDHVADHRYAWIVFLASAVLPVAGLHIALAYPERRGFARRGLLSQTAPYLVSLLLFPLILYADAASPRLYRLAQQLTLFLGATVIASALALWFHSYLRSPSPMVRLRAKVFLLGPLLAVLPVFVIFGVNSAGGNLNFGLVGLSLFICSLTFAYAVLKHNVFDIPVILQRAAAYAGVLVSVTAVYVGLVLGGRSLLREFGALASPYGDLLFLAAAIPAFDPVRVRVSRLLDRTLFPSRLEFSRVIGEVTRALAGLLRPDEIVSLLLKSAGEGLGLRRMYLFRYHNGGSAYRLEWLRRDGSLAVRSGRIERRVDEIFHELRERRAVTVSEIEADDRYRKLWSRELSVLRSLGVEIVLALHRDEEITGYLLLGAKRDGGLYSSDDVDLLKVMADQAATALENAHLVREREGLARDLHDCAVQSVYALKLQAELIEMLIERDPARAVAIAEEARARAAEVMRTLRGYSARLNEIRSEAEDDFVRKARALIRDFEETRSLKIDFEIEGEEELRGMPEVLPHLFPIIQEGGMNVIKHSGASRLAIRLAAASSEIEVSLADDGRGMPPDFGRVAEGDGEHRGLRNITSRVRELGGEFLIESSPGGGTRLTIRIPKAVSDVSFRNRRSAGAFHNEGWPPG